MLPIILVIGGVGAYKGIRAYLKNNDAQKISHEAVEIVTNAEDRVQDSKQKCEEILTNYGKSKVEALTVNVSGFLDIFQKIQNIEYDDTLSIENMDIKEFSAETIQRLVESVNFIKDAGLGLTGGALGGALTAYGAYTSVMALGTAGTGAAIGSLTGAAATNATLAWLGGGTIAAGGGGMAAGAVVLGGLAAAPALLFAGWYMDNKAEKNLNNAISNKAIAEKFSADADAAVSFTEGIKKVTQEATQILSELKMQTRRNNNELKLIIQNSGTDYQNYTDEDKQKIFKSLKVIQLLKHILSVAILDEEGNLMGNIKSNLYKIKMMVEEKSVNEIR